MDLSNILLLVFSGLVAVSTVFYALLTLKLVTETRRMREVQTEPRISIRPELAENVGHGGIELVIRNEGLGSAQNIRFEFQGDPTYFELSGPIDQLPVIKNGLQYLGPNQSFRFLLGWLFGEAFTRANQEPWVFEIQYENQVGSKKKDKFVVDFSQFSQLIVGGGPPLYKMEKHLEKLQRDVHNLMTGFTPMKVITQTKREAQEEMEEFIRERRSPPETQSDNPE